MQRNNFNRDADAKIVELGIEAGLWVNSLEAGRIGIKTIEEYIIGEEKKLVQKCLRATSNMLIALAERLGECAINDFEQGFGSAGPGEACGTAEDELKIALRAVQDYRNVEKSVRSDLDTDFLGGDVHDVHPEVAECTWDWQGHTSGTGGQFDRDEEYDGTCDEQDEKNSRTQNQGSWVNNNQAGRTWGGPVAWDWDQYEQEVTTPVNGGDQGWGGDDEVDCVSASHCDGDWGDTAEWGLADDNHINSGKNSRKLSMKLFKETVMSTRTKA